MHSNAVYFSLYVAIHDRFLSHIWRLNSKGTKNSLNCRCLILSMTSTAEVLQSTEKGVGNVWKLHLFTASNELPLLEAMKMAIGNSRNSNVRGKIEIGSKSYQTLQYGSLVSSGSMAFNQVFCSKHFMAFINAYQL